MCTLNMRFPIRCLVFGSLALLACSVIAETTALNGPIELSSQDFETLTINGPATFHAIKADAVSVNGPLDFIKLKVNGKTNVSGPFTGVDGQFSDIIVHGPFEGTKIEADSLYIEGPVALLDFEIKGDVTINGPLKAKVGRFKNINTVQTPVALYDVTVNNINVKKDSGWVRPDNPKSEGYGQNNEIKLAGKTVVLGDITFESGEGVVFIRDKTAQLKGKVIGGKIRK